MQKEQYKFKQSRQISQSYSDEIGKQQIAQMHHRRWIMLEFQFWIFHIIVMCLSIYLLSQLVILKRQSDDITNSQQHRHAIQAINLWKKGYIIDIRQVKSDNCPQGFQQLIQNQFPGTLQGCHCQSTINQYVSDYVMQGSCSSQLISYGCRTIQPIRSVNMKMWKGNKLLCFKRINSISFYNSTLKSLQGISQMKTCGQGKQYQVQTLPQVSCPFTYISNQSLPFVQDYNLLQLDRTFQKNLYSYVGQQYPIADFKISEYDFCKFLQQQSISPTKQGNYILQLMNKTKGCKMPSPILKQFDRMTQQQYLQANTRLNDQLLTLPQYPRASSNFVYKLGFVRYPKWTYQCRTSQQYNIVNAANKLTFKSTARILRLMMQISIPFICLIAFLFRFYYIIKHSIQLKYKNKYNMMVLTDNQFGSQLPNINTTKKPKQQLAILVIQITSILVVFITICVGQANLVDQSHWIKAIFRLKCTDEHVSSIMGYYQQHIDWSTYRNSRLILITLIILTLIICNIIIRRKYGDLNSNIVGQQRYDIVHHSADNLMKINDQKDIDSQYAYNSYQDDSSNVILVKQQGANSNVKSRSRLVQDYRFDDIQGGGRQTGYNFYNQSNNNSVIQPPNFQILKKKKKKKGFKQRNLFKDN